MKKGSVLLCGVLDGCFILCGCVLQSRATAAPGVDVLSLGDRLRVQIDGALFTEYCYTDVPRPFFYPVMGADGKCVIRHWPMQQGQDEATDHPHHRSLWFTHGSVNGHDFWSEAKDFGKIVHTDFKKLASGETEGVIVSTDKWVTAKGETVCTDTREHRFYKTPDGPVMDFNVTIHASEGDVVFGDTKEGSMAIRLAPTLCLTGDTGRGKIANSEGVTDKDTWGKRAKWCDYYGPVEARNGRRGDFRPPVESPFSTLVARARLRLVCRKPVRSARLREKTGGNGRSENSEGESVTFRYRFYFHKGDTTTGKVAEAYERYAATERKREESPETTAEEEKK
jgi:hypothetical protein